MADFAELTNKLYREYADKAGTKPQSNEYAIGILLGAILKELIFLRLLTESQSQIFPSIHPPA